jgi:hypothetical protein
LLVQLEETRQGLPMAGMCSPKNCCSLVVLHRVLMLSQALI